MNSNRNHPTNTSSFLSNSIATPGSPLLRGRTHVTRGALRFGIGAQVLVDHELVDTYSELDPGLGQNVFGTILTVLANHLASGQTLLGDEVLPVDLRRREDGQAVEVQLAVRRFRRGARECLAIGRAE